METENITTNQGLDKEELKAFYKQGLPQFVKTLFLDPINGTYALFLNRTDKTYVHSLVLIVSTGLVFVILPYIMMGGVLREIIGFSAMLKVGITVAVFMGLISAAAFGIKTLLGKADFRNELLTGGLCGIPLTALLLTLFVARLFTDEEAVASVMDNPMMILERAGFLLLIGFYFLLLLINIVQQSLRAGRLRESLSWYLSPLSIIGAGYVTFKIVISFF